MKNRRLLALTAPLDALPFAASAWSGAAPVQDPAPQEAVVDAVEKLPAAREIIDRYLDVTGTNTVLEETSSLHVTGIFAMAGMGLEGPFEQFSAKPDKMFVSIELGGMGTITEGYDGKVGWTIHPMMGAMILEGGELLQRRFQADYAAALKNPEDYESIEVLGRETLEQEECYVIESIAKPLEGMDADETKEIRTVLEYYSIETGLIVGNEMTAASPMGASKVKSVMSEYKKFGDALFPTKTVTTMMMGEFHITISAIEYDEVDMEVFELPAAIQVLVEDAEAEHEESHDEHGEEGEHSG